MMDFLSENKLLAAETFYVKQPSSKKSRTRQKINILWTGGFDSTFRVIQLSGLPVDIQPYYVSDERKSEKLELKAIAEITKDIENHPGTQCNLLPLLIYKTTDIEPDKALTESYNRLYLRTTLGSQYEWLGRFANMVSGLELCLEKSQSSKAYKCIQSYGHILKVKDKYLTYYTIDKKNSDPDFYRVFRNFRMPHPIFTLTKLQMMAEYKQMGFENTMAKTWFCHSPFGEEPCGLCNPCKSVIEEGLAFRIGTHGLHRYRFYLRYGNKWWFTRALKCYRLFAQYI